MGEARPIGIANEWPIQEIQQRGSENTKRGISNQFPTVIESKFVPCWGGGLRVQSVNAVRRNTSLLQFLAKLVEEDQSDRQDPILIPVGPLPSKAPTVAVRPRTLECRVLRFSHVPSSMRPRSSGHAGGRQDRSQVTIAGGKT